MKITKVSTNESGVHIFPNPAYGFIIVAPGKKLASENLKLSIQNEAGKVVYESTILEGISELTIQTAHFPTGVYFLNVFDGKDVYSGKFVKKLILQYAPVLTLRAKCG